MLALVQSTVTSRLGRGQLVSATVTLTISLLTSRHTDVSPVSTLSLISYITCPTALFLASIACTHCIDASYTSRSLSVCVLDTTVSCRAKTVEPTEMPFGRQTGVRHMDATWRTRSNDVVCLAAMRHAVVTTCYCYH